MPPHPLPRQNHRSGIVSVLAGFSYNVAKGKTGTGEEGSVTLWRRSLGQLGWSWVLMEGNREGTKSR